MSHEIGQLDIPDPRLRTSSASSRAGLWTEIGEAQVTHTLFGRAKVRIIRKHDRTRRALWLMAAVAVLVVTAWQTWLAAQQVATPQVAGSAAPANAIEGAPVTRTEAMSLPAAEPTAQRDQPAPAAPAPGTTPQPAATVQTPVKPAPPATRNIAAPQPPVAPPPVKAPVAAAAATPRAAAPVAPAASNPAEVPALLNPVAQGSVPAQSPADDQP